MTATDPDKDVNKDLVKDLGMSADNAADKGAHNVVREATQQAITAVWRLESAKVVAHVARIVRGDLLHKLGRTQEASAEFTRAEGLTRNAREREFLLGRAQGPKA